MLFIKLPATMPATKTATKSAIPSRANTAARTTASPFREIPAQDTRPPKTIPLNLPADVAIFLENYAKDRGSLEYVVTAIIRQYMAALPTEVLQSFTFADSVTALSDPSYKPHPSKANGSAATA